MVSFRQTSLTPTTMGQGSYSTESTERRAVQQTDRQTDDGDDQRSHGPRLCGYISINWNAPTDLWDKFILIHWPFKLATALWPLIHYIWPRVGSVPVGAARCVAGHVHVLFLTVGVAIASRPIPTVNKYGR